MPSTLLHTLLPASCATTGRRPPGRHETWCFFFICAFLANAPDLDIAVGLMFPSHFEQAHRNYGHNVFALALWIALGHQAFRRVCAWLEPRAAWLTSAAMVLSHVLLDSMTIASIDTGMRVGVPLFWPLTDHLYSFPLALFGGVPPQHRFANPLLDRVVSARFWTEYVGYEILWGVIFFATWTLGLFAYRRLGKTRLAKEEKAPAL